MILRSSARLQSVQRQVARSLATRAHENETFLTGSSSLYAEQMYENYMADRDSVHETWRKYFDDLDKGKNYEEKYFNRPTVVVSSAKQTASTSTVGATDANKTHLAVRNPDFNLIYLLMNFTTYLYFCDETLECITV